MLLLSLTLLMIGSTMAQKSPYASRPLPGLLPRFQQPESESDGLGQRVGIPSTTLAPDLQGTLHEDKTVSRVSEWPEERQPFWFKNRQVVNSQIQHSVDGSFGESAKESHRTKITQTNLEQREEEQRIKQKIEHEHIQQQIENQKLQEEIERQEYEEEIQRQRLKEEREKQRLKEEIERERIRQERERQKLEEEREEQRLRHQREHERLVHQQQSLHIKHLEQKVQNQQEYESPNSDERKGLKNWNHEQESEETSNSDETPFWKKQKNVNSGMRLNKNSFTTTERAKKKFWKLF